MRYCLAKRIFWYNKHFVNNLDEPEELGKLFLQISISSVSQKDIAAKKKGDILPPVVCVVGRNQTCLKCG